jgi:hypothetical protein
MLFRYLALSDSTGFKPFFVAIDNAYSGLKDTNRKTIARQESIACFRGDEVLLPLFPNAAQEPPRQPPSRSGRLSTNTLMETSRSRRNPYP